MTRREFIAKRIEENYIWTVWHSMNRGFTYVGLNGHDNYSRQNRKEYYIENIGKNGETTSRKWVSLRQAVDYVYRNWDKAQ